MSETQGVNAGAGAGNGPATGLVPGIELGEELGRGGFARVYRGRQLSVDREVAVKIDNRVLDDERDRRRFMRELTAAARISSHPHVVSLVDAGTTRDGRPYLVMELCAGGTLSGLVRANGAMSAAEARDMGLALVGAVAAAHEVGILHRDIKPSNVLIDAYGTPRLADFGLAALPVPGQEVSVTLEALTPAYAAPEAFSGTVPTPQSDIWSLGATIHALISPHRSPRWSQDGSPAPIDVVVSSLGLELPDPGGPGSAALMGVVRRATHPDASQRYSSAQEMHAALAALDLPAGSGVVVGGPEAAVTARAVLPAAARAASLSGPGAAAPRQRRVPLVAVGVAGLMLGAVASWGAAQAGADGADDTARQAAGTTAGESTPAASGSQRPAPDGEDEPAPAPTDDAAVAGMPEVGQCYGGLVTVTGQRTAQPVDCGDHVWEAYAVGLLPADQESVDVEVVAGEAVVKETCANSALSEYTGEPAGRFDTEVLPVDAARFAVGARWFACLASPK